MGRPSGSGVKNGGGGMQKPLASCRGKRLPVWFCWLLWGKVYPAGHRGHWRGKITEADGGGRAAPDPGLRGRRCRVGAGLEPEGGHLVLPVADEQREVVQGTVKDGVGAVIQRLERRYMSVPPYKHLRNAGEVGGQLRRWLAGGGGVVSRGRMFGSTQCLRNCSRKVLEVLGNLKIGQVK